MIKVARCSSKAYFIQRTIGSQTAANGLVGRLPLDFSLYRTSTSAPCKAGLAPTAIAKTTWAVSAAFVMMASSQPQMEPLAKMKTNAGE